MAGEAKPAIQLGIDDAELIAGLKKVVDHFKKTEEEGKRSFTEINSAIELAQKALGLFAGAAKAVVGTIVDWTKEADEAIKIEQQFATVLRQHGEFSREAMEAQKAFASEIQRTTTTDADAVLALQTKLRAMGVQLSSLNDATKATLGLAEVTGSVEGATRVVARVISGDGVSALTRYGISAKDSGDAMRQLTALFGLAENRAQTFGGRLAQLANAWGDVKESIGSIIVQSPTINALFEELTGFLGDLADLDMSKAQAIFEDFVQGVLEVVRDVLIPTFKAMIDSVAALRDDFSELVDVVTFAKDPVRGFWEFMKNDPIEFRRNANGAFEAFKVGVEENIDGPAASAKRSLDAVVESLDRVIAKSGFRFGELEAGANSVLRGPIEAPRGGGRPPKKAKAPGDPDLLMSDEARSILDRSTFAEGLEEERKLEEDLLAFKREIADAEADVELQRLINQRKAVDERNAKRFEEVNAFRETTDELARISVDFVAGGAADAFVTFGQALGQGFEDAGAMFKSLLGGMLTTLGQTLIQFGTAAVLGGTLGTVAPWLIPVTGGPAAIAVGAAAIAGGVGLVAAGTALGGGGGGGGARSSAPAGGSSFRRGGFDGPRNFAPEGFSSGFASDRPQEVNVNVTLGGRGVVLGNDRAVGRAIGDVLRQSGTLLPSGA